MRTTQRRPDPLDLAFQFKGKLELVTKMREAIQIASQEPTEDHIAAARKAIDEWEAA